MRAATSFGCTVVMLLAAGFESAGQTEPAEMLPAQAAARGALLERLLHRPGQVRVLQTSSHNKTGHNGDENWPLYVDEHGDDVIFDAAGPGCVRSMWGTHFAEDAVLKFYFDGEMEPRYRVREVDFYAGKHADFPPPLVSYERRGHYDRGLVGNSFVPIPFAKSLKIAVEGESRFFHVLYELYPYGTPVETFTGAEDRAALLDSFSADAERAPYAGGLEIVEVAQEDNPPGTEVTLVERSGAPGIVRGIEIEADGSPEFFRESVIRMRWDGHVLADVQAPTGIFFGCANHAADVATLPVAVERLDSGRVRLLCRFPMPYWQEARIVWQNRSAHPLGPLRARVWVGPNALEPGRSGHFTALYRAGVTTYGRDWLLFDGVGTGWLVGVVQSMQNGHYCEGDEHFSVDGAVSPQINGTGSEDYYLACFWPNLEFSSPFASCAGDAQVEGGGHLRGAYRIPSSYARFHLECPIPFQRSIDARIQHGGLSHLNSDYRSLAFAYVRKRPALSVTDFIDVGNTVSEAAHQYAATRSEPTGWVTARPEGEAFAVELDERGRRHAGGEIGFTIAVDRDNAGVRLRRRLDQGSPRQTADVYIDGEYAGTWVHGYVNEHLRWYDCDIDLHPRFTRGKEALRVTLRVETSGGRGPFTDFQYWVCCFSDS